jgi:hypothetical protein
MMAMTAMTTNSSINVKPLRLKACLINKGFFISAWKRYPVRWQTLGTLA